MGPTEPLIPKTYSLKPTPYHANLSPYSSVAAIESTNASSSSLKA